MTSTPFYAIDQEHLPERLWELADVYADLRALAGSEPEGVRRITVADLRLVLDCCDSLPDELRTGPHRNAIARVRAAVESAGDVDRRSGGASAPNGSG